MTISIEQAGETRERFEREMETALGAPTGSMAKSRTADGYSILELQCLWNGWRAGYMASVASEAKPVGFRYRYNSLEAWLYNGWREPDSVEKKHCQIEMLYTHPPAPAVPDAMLCNFYEVDNWPDLVRELVSHIEQLQDSARRNVKPWQDTFPPTLLPAYIERIRREDEACRAEMLNHSGDSNEKAEPVTAAYRLALKMAIVPRKLTAENGAKALLLGEFKETAFISCPECLGDDECESCDGSGHLKIEVPVSWTTIKAIWSKAIEHFAPIRLAAAPDEIDKFVDQVCGNKPADHQQ